MAVACPGLRVVYVGTVIGREDLGESAVRDAWCRTWPSRGTALRWVTRSVVYPATLGFAIAPGWIGQTQLKLRGVRHLLRVLMRDGVDRNYGGILSHRTHTRKVCGPCG